jgi:protoporphyrinogen/coproporphyrinogen III oxidase
VLHVPVGDPGVSASVTVLRSPSDKALPACAERARSRPSAKAVRRPRRAVETGHFWKSFAVVDSPPGANQSPHVAPHVAVIGGGISGLAAAYFVRKARPDVRVSVFEASGLVGGKLRVAEVAELRLDVGAESLLARRSEAIELAREVGLDRDLTWPLTTQASIWFGDRLVPLPARTIMGVPGDLSTVRDSGLFGVAELARIGAERQLSGLPLGGDVPIGALVAERLGHAVADRLVEPLLAGVYAGHADKLSLDATVPALGAALRRRTSLLDAARDIGLEQGDAEDRPVFAGIVGGVGRLAEAVAQASGAEISTGATVRGLARDDDSRWRVLIGPTVATEAVQADAVVVAVPAAPAARLLADIVPEAAAHLARIEYASVAIVTLLYRVAEVAGRLPGSGFLVPPSQRALLKAVTFSSNKWRWLAVRDPDIAVVRGSVGRHGDEHELQRPDEDLARTVAGEIARATQLTTTPIAWEVTRWGGALPQYAIGHLDRVAAIRAAVAAIPGLAVAGAAYDGVGIAACIASAAEAADQVLASLHSNATMGS